MARGPKPKIPVRLTSEEYANLQHISRLRKAPHAQVVRAKILVLAYEHPDWDNATIAKQSGCSVVTVRRCRAASRNGPALKEKPRPGAPRFFSLNTKSANHSARLHLTQGIG